LLQIRAISLSKQEIATGSIRPAGNVWHHFLKEGEGTRLHFRKQLLASTSIGKNLAHTQYGSICERRERKNDALKRKELEYRRRNCYTIHEQRKRSVAGYFSPRDEMVKPHLR
jgi:hypothetical protein